MIRGRFGLLNCSLSRTVSKTRWNATVEGETGVIRVYPITVVLLGWLPLVSNCK